MKIYKNKTIVALVISAFISISMIVLASSNIFKGWQLSFADTLYDPNHPSDDIVIVYVDQKTIEPGALGEYNNWNRGNFAQALKNINKYDPKVVVFDFFFRAAKDQETDEEFKNVLSQTKNPVIIYKGNPQEYDAHKGYYINPKDKKDVVLPNDLFSNLENIHISLADALKDSDSVTRRLLPVIEDEALRRYDENMAFAIARIVLGAQQKPVTPQINPGQYTIKINEEKSIHIPLEDGQMLINFFSNTSKYPNQAVSFFDVYNDDYKSYEKSPEQIFKNKIVLIGPLANFFGDSYPVPGSIDAKMPGIQIQANALQTILEQKFLRNFTLTEKSLLIFFLALTGAFCFIFTKIRYSLLYLFGVPLVYSSMAKPAFQMGIILDLVHPYITVIVTFAAIYLYRYVTEFKEKLALQSAFSKYVNPTLVKQIAEHPENLKLGGEKREATVIFTDIAHFTSISEKLKPESLVALLNEYFQAMSDVIMAEGGTLDKFEGDAIMAFFGAPIPQTDHALRATRAALNMRLKLNQLLQKWSQDAPLPGGEPKPQIDFRCGISSGEVIVGNMGSSARFDYTVMGDIVNLGSRLEGANKKYNTRIMMSQKTHDMLNNQFETRELDTIQVVGKAEPIKVFELLAPKGQLPAEILTLLQEYAQAMELYHNRKFAEALEKFTNILKTFPQDGPSQLYRQRCEVLKDFPPRPEWNGVFEMGSK